MGSTSTSSKPSIRVLDPDTYANGDQATYGLPLEQFRYLRDEEPCFLAELDHPELIDRVWIFSRFEDISAIDRDPVTYAANRGFINSHVVTTVDPTVGGSPSMLSQDGKEHRNSRQTVNKAFTPRFARQMEEKFRGIARDVVERAIQKGTFNFVADVAGALPVRALGHMLGIPDEDQAKVFALADATLAPYDERVTPSLDTAYRAMSEISAYALELADLKRRQPGDDIVTQIVQAVDAGNMSEDELVGNVQLLVGGAVESTRTSMSHGIDALMHNPDQMAWMRDHRDDVPVTAIREMTRVASPFTHFLRTVTTDVEWHGKTITAGERVCIMLASGNFDDRVFTEPERFDLARDEGELVFGRGPHTCIGRHIAILEIKVMFEELFQRIRSITPAGDVLYTRDNHSRGILELPVTIKA